MSRGARRAALALAVAALSGCAPAAQGPISGLEAPPPVPEGGTSWLETGRSLLAAGQPEQAGDAFIRSLRVEGMSAEALTGAGVAAARQGLLTEARRHFERARRRAPRSAEVHNNLGAVLYGLGEIHAARQAFRTALELSGGAGDAAARNLARAEHAIAEAAAAAGGAGPAAAGPRVQRLGSAEYRLLAAPAGGAG